MTSTLQAGARMLADAFESAKRADGATFRRLKDDAPGWAANVVYDAHAGMLPDDWRYACIESAADAIAESVDFDDDAHEFADGYVDTYNSARIEWLASHGERAGYCDEAVQEYCAGGSATDIPGIIEAIGLGQYVEALEVYALVLEALRELDDAGEFGEVA